MQAFVRFRVLGALLPLLAAGCSSLVPRPELPPEVALAPAGQTLLDERIAPVGRVVLRGAEDPADAVAPMAAAPAPVEAQLTGPQVYNMACNLCHAPPGIGGAPPLGDAAAWEARVAQGLDVLQTHAIEGYQGQTGFMPTKGGRVDLSDQEVRDAVAFMVEQLGQ